MAVCEQKGSYNTTSLLKQRKKSNVFNEECNSIIRVGNKLMQQYNITNNNDEPPQQTQTFIMKITKQKLCMDTSPEYLKKTRELIITVVIYGQKIKS